MRPAHDSSTELETPRASDAGRIPVLVSPAETSRSSSPDLQSTSYETEEAEEARDHQSSGGLETGHLSDTSRRSGSSTQRPFQDEERGVL